MSDWKIPIAHRSRDDTLADVAEAARELPLGEDRDVSRQLALGAAGELLDGCAG